MSVNEPGPDSAQPMQHVNMGDRTERDFQVEKVTEFNGKISIKNNTLQAITMASRDGRFRGRLFAARANQTLSDRHAQGRPLLHARACAKRQEPVYQFTLSNRAALPPTISSCSRNDSSGSCSISDLQTLANPIPISVTSSPMSLEWNHGTNTAQQISLHGSALRRFSEPGPNDDLVERGTEPSALVLLDEP